MVSIAALRDRSTALFTDLAVAQTRRPRRSRRAAAVRPGFSWFDPADAVGAAALSFRLAALAASRARVNDALSAALDHVDEQRSTAHPEQLRQGLAIFVTHNVVGRRLAKPRTVAAAPRLFRPPPARGGAPALSLGGLAPGLDYWREDALANEHHEHWHQVYPFTGLPPRDFTVWATETPRADMVAILEALAPGQNWDAQVDGATVAQLAGLFAQVVGLDQVFGLPAELYRLLFRLNDRQGELFFYMHEQMLARYDAELLSNDLSRVAPFGPAEWAADIPEGYDPETLTAFGVRDENEQLAAASVTALGTMLQEIDQALQDGTLRGPQGAVAAIDRSNLGEAVESTVAQLRELDPNRYPGLHNSGHVFIARLSQPAGVMISTVTAIRDQVFWRWHKHIDDLNAAWQDSQPAQDFTDAPTVVVRNGLAPASNTEWASPDIILCRTVDLPAGADPAALGEQLFGGANWSTDFQVGPAGGLVTVDELTTTMASVVFGGRRIRYLTHEPLSYFLRIENETLQDRPVTVRIFLAPATAAGDRRAWIELDKFPLTVPAATRLVAYRPDTESSVVKRPVDLSPAGVLGNGGGPEENSYCDCGWPYTLLLPRGTPAGMSCRLMVVCTDADLDQVPEQESCGSMSFCGAVDRYPDTRDMGYPFARPFTGPTATAIRDTIIALPSAAARTVTVRHTG